MIGALKNPTGARVTLLLGHGRSLQLFVDTALEEERKWKGGEHQLCSCRQVLEAEAQAKAVGRRQSTLGGAARAKKRFFLLRFG